MAAAGPPGPAEERPGSGDISALLPMVRRIVASRVPDKATADDLVQETVTRVLAAVDRIEPGMPGPYAIVTARNVVTSLWRDQDRQRRNQHRVVDLRPSDSPDDDVLAGEDRDAISAALARLGDRERATLLAHEVAGRDTRSLAVELGSTAGAVAAQLNRTRARLRVEYLLAVARAEPPTDRCRPVLLALSSGDRRRQREVDAARHLLECEFCAKMSEPLMDRGRTRDDDGVRVPVRVDADVVAARQAAREAAAHLGFPPTDLTAIATAVSEVTRNVVKFAGSGEVVIQPLADPRRGIRIVVWDVGPGIPDVDRALQDGYSTYEGLGLGLPGARRLVDEFAIVSEVGRGTTVTMTKWWGER